VSRVRRPPEGATGAATAPEGAGGAGAWTTFPATRGEPIDDAGGLAALVNAHPLARERALELVRRGTLSLVGQLSWGSNATLLGVLEDDQASAHAIYKPRRGERPLWDFPSGTLCQREVAAYAVSEAMGWSLVPPTALRNGPFGRGMVQLYVAHDPDVHFLALDRPDPGVVARLVAFDHVINNADRKSGHVLQAGDGRLWAIDHGVAFHVEPKLRTVIWSLAGEPLPRDVAAGIEQLLAELGAAESTLSIHLDGLLAPGERAALARRVRQLLDDGIFPAPAADRRHMPWPPV